MQQIHQQLKTIIYCFAALIGLIILLILSGAFGIKTLMQRQDWVDHTNNVMNQIEIAEKLFSNADYAGRNEIITGQDDPKIASMRQMAFEKLAEVKALTTDNSNQTDNFNSLESAIKSNFEIQDEQLANAVKTPTQIIYKIDTTAKRIQFTEAVDSLFVRIKLNEINLLRDDRMPRLVMWQWRLIYFGGVIVALLFITALILFVFHIRLLRRNIEALQFMEQSQRRSKAGMIEIPESDIRKVKEFLGQSTHIQLTSYE